MGEEVPVNNLEENKNSKSKTLFEAVGVETIIILLLAVVIVGIMSYLNIIPLSKLNPFPQKSAQPEKGFDSNHVFIPSPTVNPNLPADITAISEIPTYTVTLEKKEELIKLLRGWEIFGRIYYNKVEDYAENKPIEKITIYLTDKIQSRKSQVDSAGNTITAVNTIIKGNAIDYYVYVNPTTLQAAKGTNAGGYVMSALLRDFYNLSHQKITDTKKRDADILMVLQAEIPKNYILISPK